MKSTCHEKSLTLPRPRRVRTGLLPDGRVLTSLAGDVEIRRQCAGAGRAAAPVPGERRMCAAGQSMTAQAGGQDAEPPKRLVVIPWGTTSTVDGPVVVDEQTGTILPQRQRQFRADRVPIDFDHEAAFGKNKGKPRDIAGYGTPRVIAGEGVVLTDIRWTPTGRKFWANYEDLSPAFTQQEKSGRVTFLDSVALTPRGVIEGLTLFSAEPDDPDGDPPDHKPKPEIRKTMDTTKLKAFLKSQGVACDENADAETLMSLAEEAMEKMTMSSGEKKTVPAAGESEVLKKLSAMEQEMQALKASTGAATKAAEDARKAEIIRTASAEGKVLPPDSVIAKMSADDLKATADAAPAGTVRTGKAQDNPDHKAGAGEKEVKLSADDIAIGRGFGIEDEAELRKLHAFGDAPMLASVK